jgi:hypothetical protein
MALSPGTVTIRTTNANVRMDELHNRDADDLGTEHIIRGGRRRSQHAVETL